jgi:putative DNA primase/helicase
VSAAFAALVEELERQDCNPRGKEARCPAHDDRKASLSIGPGREGALIHCQAGCELDDVLSAIGWSKAMLFDKHHDDEPKRAQPREVIDIYVYVDESGEVLFRVCRTADKRFFQERPDTDSPTGWRTGLSDRDDVAYRRKYPKPLPPARRVLYRLPEVLEGIRAGEPIHIVEGEKDVEALRKLGKVATCNPGGAGKWRDEYTETLSGAKVAVIADRDKPGRAHAHRVKRSLEAHAATVAAFEPTQGKDIADHLQAGGKLVELAPLEDDEPPMADAPASPRSVLVEIKDVKAEPVRWAWQDRIALRKLTALAGRPKIGKGLIYSHLIAQVTRGALDGDISGPRNAIIVTTEDEPGDTLKPRLMAAGADLARVSIFQMGSKDEPVPFRVPQDADELGRRVNEKNAALVVIDPLMEFIDGKVDSH